MTKRLRISLDAEGLTPEQVSVVLGDLGEHFDYNVPEWEEGAKGRLEYEGSKVGYWTVVEV